MDNSITYPFPGMDPWLEQPGLWGDVHFRIIAALANYLSPILTPHYYVAVGTRTYVTTTPDSPAIRYLDVTVVEGPVTGLVKTTGSVVVAEPVMVEVPLPETVEEAYLEVREPLNGDVITAIELLSPINKRPGAGRDKYLQKRLEIFSTYTHLVEIDLLRGWQPLPFAGAPKNSDYRILIRRGEEGSRGRLYLFNVQDLIPRFPLPLQAGDTEPVVDLGNLLKQIYQEASYHLRINYKTPPNLPLRKIDGQWAREVLESHSSVKRDA